MKPTDLIQEVDLSKATSWLAKRGAFGVERAALAKDEELQQFRVQRMVNDMKMAFNDAVSGGLISKKASATKIDAETMKSSISAMTPEDRTVLKKSIEERIKALKTSSGATTK